MRNRSYYILSVILVVLVVSCKKEPLPELPDENEPYYSVKGKIEDEDINLNVGQDGVLIAQGITYNNGIKSYFGQVEAPGQDIFIRIEFTTPQAPYNTQGVDPFIGNDIEFLVHQPGCKTFDFGNNLTQGNFVYAENELGNFQMASELNFEEYGEQEVSLKFVNVSQNSYSIPVLYGYDYTQINPDFNVYANGDTTVFVAQDQEGSHEWYIDGALVSEESSFEQVVAIGIHKLEHIKQDEFGNEAKHVALVRITDYVLDWKMNLVNCSGSNPSNNFGKVTVTVKTGGEEYKSDRAISNLDSPFDISNVEFVGNSTSQPDWAVFDFFFEAELTNQNNTESLSLTEMKGTFNIGLH